MRRLLAWVLLVVVVMAASASALAAHSQSRAHALYLAISRAGSVRLGAGFVANGSVVRCTSSCPAQLPYTISANRVKLIARAASGWKFKSWQGGCRGRKPTCTIRPRGNVHVRAIFSAMTPGLTRANPVPLGQAADIADGFRLKVVSVTPDAQLSVPAPAGAQNFVVLLLVTYVGGGRGDLLPLLNNLDATGAHNATYTTYENGCHAALPTPTLGDDGFEIFSGQSLSGNICWRVARNDASSLVLFIGSGFTHTTWFALH